MYDTQNNFFAKIQFQYPSTEPSSFSLEIEVCGPHQILNRGENSFNFVFIASRGLVDYLRNQNIRHPVMIIQDELRNQFENCQTQGIVIFEARNCHLYS